MTPLTMVIVAETGGTSLAATLDALRRQTRPSAALVIVTPDAACISPSSASADIDVVVDPNMTPAHARNVGAERAKTDFVCWLNEGDRPQPAFVELVLAHLDTGVDFVVPTSWIGLADENPLLHSPALTLDDVLSSSGGLPFGASVTRRSWRHVGGFDDLHPPVDEYDFWIRMLAAGYRGIRVPTPLVGRPLRRTSSSRTLDDGTLAHSIEAIVRRHEALFASRPSMVLSSRVRERAWLDNRYLAMIEERERITAELVRNAHEIEELKGVLLEHGATATNWGDFRQVWPVSRDWGYDRGTPVDRVYIEQFLDEWAQDVKGHVLEVQESDLTRRTGGRRVERSDVVDLDAGNPNATIIADLRDAPQIPSDTFDCFILTQTVHVIDDMTAVLKEAYRILKPGGVLLVTLPSASRVCLEYGPDGDFWRLTEAGARRLLAQVFRPDHLCIRSYGNVLTNVAFLMGLAAEEVTPQEFAAFDPFFPLLVGVRAVKPATAERRPILRRTASDQASGVVLLYHRITESDDDVHALSIPRRSFSQQMEYLKAAFNVMPLADLIRACREDALPECAVAITFDDGYRDNLERAVPILAELELPVTFFVTTQALEGSTEYWWDALQRAVLSTPSVPDALEITIGDETVALSTSSPEARRRAHENIYGRLVRSSAEVRTSSLAAICRWAGVPERSFRAPIMTANELQQLAHLPGCSIGTHTVNHLALGHQGPEVVADELHRSVRTLSTLTGTPITSLAYPYGDYTARTIEVVRAAGLSLAVTCEPRRVSRSDDPLAIPRIEVTKRTVREFQDLINGSH